MAALPPKADIDLEVYSSAASIAELRPDLVAEAKRLHLSLRARKAVLTAVGAVYGGVDLTWRHLGSVRHGSIFYRARSDSRGWRCFFPVRDGTT